MADRLLKVLGNGRYIARGFFRDPKGYWSVYQDKDATLSYTVDWSAWLGSDTIASAAFSTDGLTVSGSNTTTTTTATVSANRGCPGELTIKVTTAAGLVNELTLRFYQREM